MTLGIMAILLLALQAGAGVEADSATIIIQEKSPPGISHLGSLGLGQVVYFFYSSVGEWVEE
jgi:hypothetical protein